MDDLGNGVGTSPVVAFEDVTVVPMDSERRIPHQTVLVDGSRIARITPVSEATAPHGAHRVDGRGKYLMPGLSDMHCHLMSESELLLYAAHGVTTVRNLHGLPRHLTWRQRIARGELMGPAIHTAGPIVGGRPSKRLWSTSVSTREEALQAVAAIRWAGYDGVKVYDELSQDAYRWTVDAAVRFNLPVWGHVPWTVGFRGAVRAGQRSVEHSYGFLEALLPPDQMPTDMTASRAAVSRHAESLPDDGFRELAELASAQGTWSCPTAVLDRRRTEDVQAILDGPEASYFPPGTAEALRRGRQSLPAEYDAQRVYPLYLKAIKALHDAGAGLLTGTDAPMPGILPGMALHYELQVFTEAGLTPFQALRASTTDAARFLGADGEWGVVREGARADLLLLDADPLADVANAAKIAGVMLAGRWHPADELRDSLDQMAGQMAAERRTPHRRPSLPTAKPTTGSTTQTRRYETEQAGLTVAVDEVTISAHSGGGHVFSNRASIQSVVFGTETGTYHCEVRTDIDGTDQSARFDYEGLDGREQVLLTRNGDTVRIDRTDSWSGEHGEVIEAPAHALLARTHVMLLVQLGRRLDGLDVGATRTFPFVGPGLPPAAEVYPGEVHVQRLADPSQEDAAAHRYSFDLYRPNFAVRGTLTVDGDGWPTRVEMTGSRTTPFEALSQTVVAVD